MFSPQTYQERREILRKNIQSGIILLPGNDESPMNYADNPYPYRQDSTFLYYFGIDKPGLAGILDIDEGKDILFGDELSVEMIVWMGTQKKLQTEAGEVGIKEVRPYAGLFDYIRKEHSKGRKIHFLPPYRPENKILILKLLDIHPADVDDRGSVELAKAVVAQREIKTEEEIREIEEAVNISADMHIEAMKMIRPGMRESEIVARVEQIGLIANVRPSFPVIATINGQNLHNHYHGNIVNKGDLFLLDAGAESSMHYAGDLSSTFPVDEKFTERQKVVYEIALQSHETCISMLSPGVAFKDVHLAAARAIFEGLKDLNLTKGNAEEAVEQGAHALFFPCGTGHMMGLDVHDMENIGEVWVGYEGQPKSTQFGLKSLRLGKKLKPGFVITVEPGIYFIPELIDMWRSEKKFTDFLNYDEIEKFKDYGGVRNEEDFLITESGARLLGKPIPKTVKEVEDCRMGNW